MKKTIVILFILILSLIANPNCPAVIKSPDISGDGRTDFNDFALLASQWLNSSQSEPNIPAGWPVRYNGRSNNDDRSSSLTLDNFGNIYVTGCSYSTATGNDYMTIKYDSNGNHIWTATYNGLGNGNDTALGIVIDKSGNIYITGYSYGGPITKYDYATIKYDSNGNQLWVARYNGPTNGNEYGGNLILDSSGNIYVIGYNYGTGISATIKYDPNGNQIWSDFCDGLDITYANGYIYVTVSRVLIS